VMDGDLGRQVAALIAVFELAGTAVALPRGTKWRYTMQLYAGFAIVAILPAAFLIFGATPEPVSGGATGPEGVEPRGVLVTESARPNSFRHLHLVAAANEMDVHDPRILVQQMVMES
jgi:hypothetical protein